MQDTSKEPLRPGTDEARPMRAGNDWYFSEYERLAGELRDGLTDEDIAQLHQRSVGAIRSAASRMLPPADPPYTNEERILQLREALQNGYDWRPRAESLRSRRVKVGNIPAAVEIPPGESRPAYSFDHLTDDYATFVAERDWGRFHDPKSMILALVGEVGELAELFQWLTPEESITEFARPGRKARAEEEMSDVLIYLIGLAQTLDIDLIDSARRKLAAAADRYPVDQVRGRATYKQ